MAAEEGTNTQSVGSPQSAPTAPEEPSTPETTLEQGQENTIEADTSNDADSALGSDMSSLNASLASSIYNYTYEVCHAPNNFYAYRIYLSKPTEWKTISCIQRGRIFISKR